MFSGVGVWVYVEADQYLVLIFKKFNVTITLLHFEIGHFVFCGRVHYGKN